MSSSRGARRRRRVLPLALVFGLAGAVLAAGNLVATVVVPSTYA